MKDYSPQFYQRPSAGDSRNSHLGFMSLNEQYFLEFYEGEEKETKLEQILLLPASNFLSEKENMVCEVELSCFPRPKLFLEGRKTQDQSLMLLSALFFVSETSIA